MRSAEADRHSPSERDDAPDAMREWRWRSYTDHLEDLGYDLDGGPDLPTDPTPPAGAAVGRSPERGLPPG